MAARGVARVLEKLEVSVKSGQYYEAHQMYRTLYFRYLAQQKYADLLELLFKGSKLLLEHDQQGSGADLALLFIDVLNKSETKPNEEWIEKLVKLFELISSNIPERETYLSNAVKWSMDSEKKGHPLLHKKIAEVLRKETKYVGAHKHFLRSSDGSAYADMLIELHTSKGMKSEIDLFLAQAVLQILCLKDLHMATDTFNKYTSQHPELKSFNNPGKGEGFPFPLLNFLWFLLEAIREKNVAQFQILREWYKVTLNRDPNYFLYLDNIGRIWFGLEVKKHNKNPNSLLGGLFKSLIGEIESSDDDDIVGQITAPDLD